MTQTYSQVYENVTEIEICVGVKPPYETVACPVSFDFNLTFTIDTDTGIYNDLFHDYILIFSLMFLQSLLVILVVRISLLGQLLHVIGNSVSLYLL